MKERNIVFRAGGVRLMSGWLLLLVVVSGSGDVRGQHVVREGETLAKERGECWGVAEDEPGN
jgi:hypothetical protein